ncbi:monooxygenase [Penicillium argentinense]|uniref:Monooxygenase n=1 Tax=Penicillium argentinense TaxID=1131581 RepID=A0A9W9FNG6_9EURO|nr:monooxygenase [Penicillium argentinense]KAJ5103433.1 monooxygenase [Penicillium argentinense]
MEDYDVIIIGAGISGINAAYRLQSQFPKLRYAILETREDLGGTWDLFKYPGIRSDSDLFTFGFAWHPWDSDNPIAHGHSIVSYLKSAAAKYGITDHILFKHRVVGVDWSSVDNNWSLSVDCEKTSKMLSARFLVFGTGYYDYNTPLQTEIPGLDQFQGQIVHPQFWPEELDYTGKKVVIIGSGATAITLLPSMADKAAHVTMLQRSPSYILSLPNRTASWLGSIIPTSLHRRLQRIRFLYISRYFFLFCQSFPNFSRWLLGQSMSRQLPKNISSDPHFKPRYNPWDQRLCVCPDGDFFKSLHTGRANVKTDTIRTITSSGMELNSGDKLDADIIVTATGLRLQLAGAISLCVDGVPLHAPDKFTWRGVMLQDLPNAAFLLGYVNASWTLGADASSQFICRLLGEMNERGVKAAVPRMEIETAKQMVPRRLLNLNSTYVLKAQDSFPKAGDQGPWKPRDNYFDDIKFAKSRGALEGLEFLGEKKML